MMSSSPARFRVLLVGLVASAAFVASALPASADLGAGAIKIVPTGPTTVQKCIPFRSNDYDVSGIVHRNVEAFTASTGSKIAFDLGRVNDVDIHRNIFLS